MEIKSVNPRLRQDQIAKQLGCSGSALQGYRNDIIMLSPTESQQIVTKEDKTFQIQISMIIQILIMCSKDLKWLQMTSNDLKNSNSLNPTQKQTLLSTTQRIRKTKWKEDPCTRLLTLTMDI